MKLLDKCYIGLLLVIFGGIVLHAPISVGLSALFPAYDIFFKAWKEVLMVAAAAIGLYILVRENKLSYLKKPIIIVIAAYVAVHLLLIPVDWQGIIPTMAGLLIDLRYVGYFIIVYLGVMLYPKLRKKFIVVLIAGALIVMLFGVLQVFILPRDILEYIGYSKYTIIPYLLVDANDNFVRINSTLRGPNPLGAYAMIILTVIAAYLLNTKKFLFDTTKKKIVIAILAALVVTSPIVLWSSYSRSALVAAVVALGIVFVVFFIKRIPRWFWITGVIVAIIGATGLYTLRDTYFVANIILHKNVADTNNINSNEGHVESLNDGLDRMIHQPLGGGIGSTGSASLYTDEPLIIENQYLFVAHETGWLGLILFIVIIWLVLRQLWERRRDWLALGVFASGIGLLLIGLLLPVWVDDTVAIIWWGLAAIALARKPTGGQDERSINKTTKRAA